MTIIEKDRYGTASESKEVEQRQIAGRRARRKDRHETQEKKKARHQKDARRGLIIFKVIVQTQQM